MANQENFMNVEDRITYLSDDIRRHILSFLPARDAVRTSILSSRWAYLFASMSTLDFSNMPPLNDDVTENHFKDFVDSLLLFPNHSLECFRLGRCSLSINDYVQFHDWIDAVLCRGIKEIKLHNPGDIELPTRLFTSESLVTLKLLHFDAINVPTNVCLPNLKTLHLIKFEFRGVTNLVFSLVSSCAVLEELVIEQGNTGEIVISEVNIDNPSLKKLVLDFRWLTNYVIKINAPNLVYLKYIHNVANCYTLSEMKSLAKAIIDIGEPIVSTYNVDRARGISHLVHVIRNLRFLTVRLWLPETRLLACLQPALSFPNLVELNFQISESGVTLLVELLHRMPILERLKLCLGSAQEDFNSLPATMPRCLLFHLKEVEFSYRWDGEHLLKVMSYFLKHALVLEKFILSGIPYSDTQSSLMEKISSLPKESKKCQVVFRMI